MFCWVQERVIARTGVTQSTINRLTPRIGHVRVSGPEDHQKFTAYFFCARQRSRICVLTEFPVMDACAVVTNGCAYVGLERSTKSEVAANAETQHANFPATHFRVLGKP